MGVFEELEKKLYKKCKNDNKYGPSSQSKALDPLFGKNKRKRLQLLSHHRFPIKEDMVTFLTLKGCIYFHNNLFH